MTRTSLNDAVSSATTDFPLSILPRWGQIEGAVRGGHGSKVGVGGDGGGARAAWEGGSGAEGLPRIVKWRIEHWSVRIAMAEIGA